MIANFVFESKEKLTSLKHHVYANSKVGGIVKNRCMNM